MSQNGITTEIKFKMRSIIRKIANMHENRATEGFKESKKVNLRLRKNYRKRVIF